MERRVLPTATDWNSSPIWYSIITAPPSAYSPMIIAPMEAMDIRKFSSNTCPWEILRMAFQRISQPMTRYAAANTARWTIPNRLKRPAPSMSSVCSRTNPATHIAAAMIMRVSIFFCFFNHTIYFFIR